MTKYWQNLLALGRSIQVANFEYEFRIRRRGKIRIEKLNLFIDCPQTKTSALLNLIKFQQPDIEKICQRSIQIKVSVAYHWKRKGGDNEIKKSKGIHCLQTSDDVLKILKTIIQQRKEKRQQCLLFDRRWKLIKNEVL